MLFNNMFLKSTAVFNENIEPRSENLFLNLKRVITAMKGVFFSFFFFYDLNAYQTCIERLIR